MVNNKQTNVGFDNYHQPGCMLGMLDILGYRNWRNNVKKMLPHKSHCGRTHARGNYDLLLHSEDDGHADEGSIDAYCCDLAEQTTRRPASASKKSTRARIKALMGFSTRPSLQRTYSIHHMEPLDDYRYLDQMNTDWQSPIIVLEADNSSRELQGLLSPKAPGNLVFWHSKDQLQGITDVAARLLEDQWAGKGKPFSLSSNIADGNEQDREFSGQRLESIDVLEVYRINKDHFMNNNKKSKVSNLHRLHSLQTPIRRAKLTKSGSFPMTDQSARRNLVPAKLEDKQREPWSVPKEENYQVGNYTLLASRSLKDLSSKIMSSIVVNTAESTEEQGLNAPNSVTNFSTDSKVRGKDTARAKEEKGSKDSRVMDEIDEFLSDMNKHSFYSLRRATSLNESRNRNVQLSESSSRRKINHFKSLSLADEFEIISGWVDAKHFRGFSSLHDASTYLPSQNEGLDEENSGMTPELGCTTAESCDHDQPDERLPTDPENCASQNAEDASTNLIERRGDSPTLDCIPELTVFGINDWGDTTSFEIGNVSELQETQLTGLGSEGAPNSVSETCLEEDISCTAGLEISEGKEMDDRSIHSEERNSSNNTPDESIKELLSGSTENKDLRTVDKAGKACNAYILPIDLESDNDATFIYVRNILESLGVVGNQSSKQAQPVDVSFLNEIDTPFPDGNCDNQLWFDAIYESLLDIYERSYTYWPKALSSNCRVRPLASGHQILEEVWSGISKKLNSSSEPDCTLDQIVALDLRKDDGWMNFQPDSECVALDLEDIIFDEILDEILYARGLTSKET